MKHINKGIYITVFLMLIIYSNSWHNNFHFDDFHTITDNIYIRSLDNFTLFFTDVKTFSTIPSHASWRPIVTLSLAFDYYLANGLKVEYFHYSMLVVFSLLLIVIYYFFQHIFLRSTNQQLASILSLFASAWYGFHPVCAETVNYVIARSDLLSTFFLLLSFLLYFKSHFARKYFLYLIPLLIGVAAKPIALMFVPLVIVYELIFNEDKNIFSVFSYLNKKILRLAIPLVLFFIAMYSLIKYMEADTFEPGGTSLFNYMITQPFVYIHYVEQVFLPLKLSADTDWQAFDTLLNWNVAVGFLFLFSILYLIYSLQNSQETKPIAFGLSFFLISLIPTTFVPLAEVNNDHRMFLPIIGLVIATVQTIYVLQKKFNINKIALSSVFLIILGAYAFGTYQRNKVWFSEETLWKDTIEKSPKNGRAWLNYGLAKMTQGLYPEAKELLLKALELTPNYSSGHINLGIVYQKLHNLDSASYHFEKALWLGNNLPSTLYFYARYKSETGQKQNAIDKLYECLDMASGDVHARELLMKLLFEENLLEQLEDVCQQTIKIIPHGTFAKVYLEKLKLGATYQEIIEKEALLKNTPEAYLNLSLIYYQNKQFDLCIRASENALKLRPDYAEAYNNICSAYNELAKFKLAEQACLKALTIAPNYQLAKNNLVIAKQKID